jgi:biotin transport system substrate-specific component
MALSQTTHHADHNLRMMIYAALLAAFIAVGAFLIIPIGPVPIVLQNLFVLLAGLLLGSRWATVSVGVYLLAGICGLPVFAGGGAGIGRLLGPTGGYLVGFLPAAFVVGFITERAGHRIWIQVAAMIGATLIIYGCGVPWLMKVANLSLTKALMGGMIPFLIGDALKIAVAVPITLSLRSLMSGLTPQSPQDGAIQPARDNTA